MRRIRHAVATSLDGYIAGPQGEADWIFSDPEIAFGELFSQFDTALIGRRTFDVMVDAGRGFLPGLDTYVFSRTLRQEDHPRVKVVADKPAETVADLRAKPGKDIWLFGGGALFRSLAEAKLVDGIEVAVIISDTFGRPWRRGLTDVAIGCAGIAAVVRGPSADGQGLLPAA